MLELPVKTVRTMLRGVSKLALRKPAHPSLGYVRLQTTPNGLRLSATDLDNTLLLDTGLNPPEPVDALVPVTGLREASRNASHGTRIFLECGESGGTITVGKDGDTETHRYETVSRDKYPSPPHTAEPVTPLPVKTLKAVLDARGCASTDPTRHVLNSVLLAPGHVAATDGRRLFHANSMDLELDRALIVPAAKAMTLFDPEKPAVLLRTEGGGSAPVFAIKQKPWTWMFRPVEGRYPEWKHVMPPADSMTVRLTLSDEDVTTVLGPVSREPALKEKDAPALLVAQEGILHLVVEAGKESTEKVYRLNPRSWETGYGVRAHVRFNLGYLVDAVKRGVSTVAFSDPLSPVLLTSEGREFLYMPLRSNPGDVPSNLRQHPTKGTMNQPNNVQPNCSAPPGKAEDTGETALERLVRQAKQARDNLRELTGLIREVSRDHTALEKEHEALKRSIRSLQRIEV